MSAYSPLDMRQLRPLVLSHPALQGTRRIGRGHFCAVYARPAADTVMKLTTDRYQYGFYTDGLRPQGPYFPRLVNDFGEVGSVGYGGDELPLYLVEMERLQSIGRDAPIEAKREARSACRFAFYEDGDTPKDRAYKRLTALSQKESTPQGLREAFTALADFVSNLEDEVSLDLHSKNVMRRGSQIVLNDPLADYRLT